MRSHRALRRKKCSVRHAHGDCESIHEDLYKRIFRRLGDLSRSVGRNGFFIAPEVILFSIDPGFFSTFRFFSVPGFNTLISIDNNNGDNYEEHMFIFQVPDDLFCIGRHVIGR